MISWVDLIEIGAGCFLFFLGGIAAGRIRWPYVPPLVMGILGFPLMLSITRLQFGAYLYVGLVLVFAMLGYRASSDSAIGRILDRREVRTRYILPLSQDNDRDDDMLR